MELLVPAGPQRVLEHKPLALLVVLVALPLAAAVVQRRLMTLMLALLVGMERQVLVVTAAKCPALALVQKELGQHHRRRQRRERQGQISPHLALVLGLAAAGVAERR